MLHKMKKELQDYNPLQFFFHFVEHARLELATS